MPARYADYLAKASKSGDETAFRHYWEMCTVLALRDGLRSGDVFVPGSRRYADPGTYLFTPEQWQQPLAWAYPWKGRRRWSCSLWVPSEAASSKVDTLTVFMARFLPTPLRVGTRASEEHSFRREALFGRFKCLDDRRSQVNVARM